MFIIIRNDGDDCCVEPQTSMRANVLARTQFEGFHYWADAPDEVAFLRQLHRHMFHVEVVIPVEHDDRDIEIILLKRTLDEYCSSLTEKIKTEGWSCERIASTLALMLANKYNFDSCVVQVLEDNENGGTVIYDRKESI